MILLDTNVVSEFMGSAPAESVVDWMNEQPASTLFFSAVSVAEITFGLRSMPEGRRRDVLAERFDQLLAAAFDSRVLPFDYAAARIYGDLRASRRTQGCPMSAFDAQIASIARAKGLAVATRNVKDFEGCGLEVVNPFESPS